MGGGEVGKPVRLTEEVCRARQRRRGSGTDDEEAARDATRYCATGFRDRSTDLVRLLIQACEESSQGLD